MRPGILTVSYEDLSWDGLLGWLRPQRHAANITVMVQKDCPTQVGVVNATAVVSGVSARTSLKSVSGDLTLDGVTGAVDANTVSGSLEAQGLDGNVVFHSVSGDLTLAEGRIGRLDARTVSGAGHRGHRAGAGRRDAGGHAVRRGRDQAARRSHERPGEPAVRVGPGAQRLRAGLRAAGPGREDATGTLGDGSGQAVGHQHVRQMSRSCEAASRRAADGARCGPPGESAAGIRRPAKKARPDEPGVSPWQAPALPAQAARRGAQARLRGDPAAAGPLHGRVRPVAGHHLPAAGPAGGGRPGHPRRVDGRKVYKITDKGRAEIHDRMDDLAELEEEITESVRDIAREVKEDVRETVRSLREEIARAAKDVRQDAEDGEPGPHERGPHERGRPTPRERAGARPPAGPARPRRAGTRRTRQPLAGGHGLGAGARRGAAAARGRRASGRGGGGALPGRTRAVPAGLG